MPNSLKKDIISGVMWSCCGRAGNLLIQIAVSIVLARLLSPHEFGLIGLLTFFIVVCEFVSESGFHHALIRKNDATPLDYSSVFYFNTALGIVIYIVFYVCSPAIANFFNKPELITISRVLFIIIPIFSLGIVQRAVYTKKGSFRELSLFSITGSIVGCIVGITLASMGYGVWALVYQMIITISVNTFCLWWFNSWRPAIMFSWQQLKMMLPFSVSMFFSDLIIATFNNIYLLIIGKFYTTTDLGYYTQGKKLVDIPAQTMTNSIHGVTYAMLAKMQDNMDALRQAYSKIMHITVYVMTVVLFAGFASAENLIIVLFTEKWRPAIIVFQIFCLYSTIFPIISINTMILKVRGCGKIIVWLEVIKRVLMIVLTVATISYGMTALLYGYLISTFLSALISMYYCGKEMQLSLVRHALIIGPYYIVCMFAIVLPMFIAHLTKNMALNLILQLTMYGLTVVVLSWFCKLSAFFEVLSESKKYIRKRLA